MKQALNFLDLPLVALDLFRHLRLRVVGSIGLWLGLRLRCFEGHLVLIIALLDGWSRVIHLHDDALDPLDLAFDYLVVLSLRLLLLLLFALGEEDMLEELAGNLDVVHVFV